jgi:ORF6N domain
MGEELMPVEGIDNKIFTIRGQKVMIDRDLAELYGVETGYLNRQVRHNIDRFPLDFMFQVTKEEYENLICKFCISNRGGTRFLPLAFTEQGVAMLSSVLRSNTAVQVNIAIMRAFVKFRQMMSENAEIVKKLDLLEKRSFKHDGDIRQLFRDIRKMTIGKTDKTGKIGFLK